MGRICDAPSCEHCEGEAPHYYEVYGVFTYLCPQCRTDLQGFMLGMEDARTIWVAKARMNQSIADPLMVGDAADTMHDAEVRLYNQIVSWIRTKKEGDATDRAMKPEGQT